jgi:hypothetical protein
MLKLAEPPLEGFPARSVPLAATEAVQSVVSTGTVYVPVYVVAEPGGVRLSGVAVMHVPETVTVGGAASGSLEEIKSATLAPIVAVCTLEMVVRTGGVRSMVRVAVPPMEALPATSVPLTATDAAQSVVPAGTTYVPV